jgi:hypothetical protein
MCCKNSDCRGIKDCKEGQAPFPYGPRHKVVCCQCPAGKVLNKENNGCVSTGVPTPSTTAKPSSPPTYESTPSPSAVPEPTPYGPTPPPINQPTSPPTSGPIPARSYEPTPPPPSDPPTSSPAYHPTPQRTYQPTPSPMAVPEPTPSGPTSLPTYPPSPPPTSAPTLSPSEAGTGASVPIVPVFHCDAGLTLTDSGLPIEIFDGIQYKVLRTGFKMCCKQPALGTIDCPATLMKLYEQVPHSKILGTFGHNPICCSCERSTPTWQNLNSPGCV